MVAQSLRSQDGLADAIPPDHTVSLQTRTATVATLGRVVAGVHSAVPSDRPYRPAMAPERVHQVLLEMAGPHLNLERVRLLHVGVPVFHWAAGSRSPVVR